MTNAKVYLGELEQVSGVKTGLIIEDLEGVMGITTEANLELIKMRDLLIELAREHFVGINVKVSGDAIPKLPYQQPGSITPKPKVTHPDHPGSQHGLNMIVPPGYPGDTFPILASSGEHVLITPQNQMRGGRGGASRGAGNTYNYVRYGDRNIVTEPAQAAFLVEKQRQAQFDEIDKVI